MLTLNIHVNISAEGRKTSKQFQTTGLQISHSLNQDFIPSWNKKSFPILFTAFKYSETDSTEEQWRFFPILTKRFTRDL